MQEIPKIPHSILKITPISQKNIKKPPIIYDLSIMNNEFEVKSQSNIENSIISSSSQGTFNQNQNHEENDRNLQINYNNAILIRDNYCITEEKTDKNEKQTEKHKKQGPCHNMTCKTNKNKENDKKLTISNENKLEILYKNDIYNINNQDFQKKEGNLYKVSDYLDHEDSNPSNSTKNEELPNKKQEKNKKVKEKCNIF